jgi:hypothetical protein
MHRPSRYLADAAIIIAILAMAVALIAPALSTTNCGGNSAALANVRSYMLFVQRAAAESPDHQFLITSATAEQRRELSDLASDVWVKGAHYLVSTAPYRDASPEPRRVLMVCDIPFTNVPRRYLLRSPPTHAASFSDGTTGLISVAEFEALDRSTLRPLDELLALEKR